MKNEYLTFSRSPYIKLIPPLNDLEISTPLDRTNIMNNLMNILFT